MMRRSADESEQSIVCPSSSSDWVSDNMGQSQSGSELNQLTDRQAEQLARRTGYIRQEIRTMYTNFLEHFPNGYIDKKTFRTIYVSMYPQVKILHSRH